LRKTFDELKIFIKLKLTGPYLGYS